MRRLFSLFVAFIMITTIFVIPGHSLSAVATVNAADTVAAKDISKAVVTCEYSSYIYRGEERRAKEFTVKLSGKLLKRDVDYKITGYKNNIYPGKATAIITGINKYKGTVNGYFNIAKVSNFKTKAIGKNYVEVSWSKQPGVTGYKIYKYIKDYDKWVLMETVKGSATSCKIDGLGIGNDYTFMIRSYVGKYQSSPSNYVYAPTKPGNVVLSSFTATPNLQVSAKWNQKKGDGYQIRIATNSDFDGAKTYIVTSMENVSQKFSGLTKGKYYYIKVRARNSYKGKVSYGDWSKYKKVKAINQGWLTKDGKKYYYKNGKPLVGSHVINGNPYYFSKSAKGQLIGADYEMWTKVKNEESKTKYLIAVSRKLNRTCVYYKKDGRWTLKYYWRCTTGQVGTWTPRGSFKVPRIKTHLKSFGDGTYVVWYATRFKSACYFHSILYKPGSKTKVVDGRLGQNLSHGCVRLKLEHAKWIYDNIDAGTRVVVYGHPR